jgi:hypothetical protein
MKIKAEKQSSNVHEPSAEGGSSRLPFDPEKYRKYLAETDRRTGSGVPTGIRTPVASVKGMCPRPLDDGDAGLTIN